MPAIRFDRFAAETREIYQQKARATQAKVAQVLRELAEVTPAPRTTADILPVLIARWMAAHPNRKAATWRSLLGTARAIFNFAADASQIQRNPVIPRSRWIPNASKKRAPRRRHHSAEEIARVLQLLDAEAAAGDWKAHRLRAVIYCVAFTGLRKLEALGLKRSDVDLEARLIHIRPNEARKLKTEESEQPVPLPPRLAEVLSDWLPRCGPSGWLFPNVVKPSPWFNGSIDYRPIDQVHAAGLRAGVAGLNFLSLRHSWATHAETLWGLSGPSIQRVLRHTTERTSLEHYRHADEDNLREIALKIHYA